VNNKKFNLLITLNLNCNDQRWNEFIFCLHENLQNKLINFIYIKTEIDENNQEQLRKYNHISSLSKKVFIHIIKNRPTFAELFAFCNNIKGMWIISNADIYFPKTNTDKLSILLERDYNKECFVLTRYNILDEMKKKSAGINISYDGLKLRTMHGNNRSEGSSIDSWIFETPFDFSKLNLNIQLGQPGCDGMMNYQLSKIRNVSNPCLSIISIHKHLGWYPWYNNLEYNGRKMKQRGYDKLMKSEGHKKSKIKFTKLNYIDKLAHKYPEIAGEQNAFSNHPNGLRTIPINIQQSTRNLLTTVDVFEHLEVKYCVVFGTLLGIYRDGGLIEHDTDTDIAVWIDNYSELVKIVEKMEENKLMLTRIIPKIISFTRGGDYIDIYFYNKKNNKSENLINHEHFGTMTPADFSKNNTVRFHNKELACPVDPEDYFQKLYGSDWSTPIKGKHAHILERERFY